MDVNITDQTTLKPYISLCGLFYLCIFKLTLFLLKFSLTQQIGIVAWVEDQKERNTQNDKKMNFSWSRNWLFSRWYVIQKINIDIEDWINGILIQDRDCWKVSQIPNQYKFIFVKNIV